MVYELKPPVDGSPGLLCFTHKERAFFREPSPPLAERIRRLKESYVLCMQWGSYHADVGETPYIDFHLACPGTVDWAPDADVRHVPLCSRDFTPDYFRPMDVPTRWDLLAVGHPIKIKRMAELLDVVRTCFDRGVTLDVLLVCALPNDPARLGPEWDHAFFENYRELFSDAEREHIDLAAFAEVEIGDRPIHPIPNELFPYIYNAASGFTLFSREEGQSKVIHEALLCGTPVVVHEELKGGGRAYLDDANSFRFGDLDEAADAFVELAERPDEHAFDPAPLRSKLTESAMAPELEAAVADVYGDLGHPYRGELDTEDIAFKLGGHTLTLRPELRLENTNDLRSRRAFLVYVDELLGTETPLDDRLAARRADLDAEVAELRQRGPLGVADRLLRAVDARTDLPVGRWARKAFASVTER